MVEFEFDKHDRVSGKPSPYILLTNSSSCGGFSGGGLASTREHVEDDDVGEQALESMGPRLYSVDTALA